MLEVASAAAPAAAGKPKKGGVSKGASSGAAAVSISIRQDDVADHALQVRANCRGHLRGSHLQPGWLKPLPPVVGWHAAPCSCLAAKLACVLSVVSPSGILPLHTFLGSLALQGWCPATYLLLAGVQDATRGLGCAGPIPLRT